MPILRSRNNGLVPPPRVKLLPASFSQDEQRSLQSAIEKIEAHARAAVERSQTPSGPRRPQTAPLQPVVPTVTIRMAQPLEEATPVDVASDDEGGEAVDGDTASAKPPVDAPPTQTQAAAPGLAPTVNLTQLPRMLPEPARALARVKALPSLLMPSNELLAGVAAAAPATARLVLSPLEINLPASPVLAAAWECGHAKYERIKFMQKSKRLKLIRKREVQGLVPIVESPLLTRPSTALDWRSP